MLDIENEIVELRGACSEMKANIVNLTGWQTTQNGALLNLGNKVDKLIFMTMGALGGTVLTMVGIIVIYATKG